MGLTIVRMIAPDERIRGYLKRFMLEFDAGLLIGTCQKPLLDEVVQVMSEAEISGFVVTSRDREECGYVVLYYSILGVRLVDFDGIAFVEKLND